ncbi:MAG: DNA mismatch repair endonuclease MutL [Clostridia bacterium]|nr:DNA mismatch repair endonuclease MutL [Clostridia bacterium]
MGVIHVLSQELSDKIAAGEVVERPASVVKELVENSIDAGATVITVEIKDGGISYMRVADNGSGMSEEDARTAFLRHATSKLRTQEDLDAIYTLGFRGEALSSILAVSKIDLFTKTADDKEGIHLYAEGGNILSLQSAGTPNGTTIVVKNLFYNTPARMKFLKKNSTEAGYISDIMSKFILAHPNISFRFINGGKEVLFSSGNNKLTDCIYTVYGKDFAKSVISVDYQNEGLRIAGVIGKSEISRPNRNFQNFFINKRYIKSPLIIRAVEEAYKNQIMSGKFPAAILNLEINPALIDINVHPTKLEVKFADEKSIYEAVYFGVKNALYSIPSIPEIAPNSKPVSQIPKTEIFAPSVGIKNVLPFSTDKTPKEKTENELWNLSDLIDPTPKSYEENERENLTAEDVSFKTPVSLKAQQERAEYIKPPYTAAQEYKIIGQIFNSYIIVERGQEMLLIDQHAAHERLKYEQLKKLLANGNMTPQTLLFPAVVNLSSVEFCTFCENKDFFYSMGFETEEFGDNSIIVRTTPSSIDEHDISELMVELISQLAQSKREIMSVKEERALYTIACKSAVKANRFMHFSEIEALLNEIFSLDNINTCPHGRPIIVSMSKNQIEKEFKRIV